MGLRAWREHRHYVNALSTIQSLEKTPSLNVLVAEQTELDWQQGAGRRDWLDKQATLGRLTASEALDIEYVKIIHPAQVIQLPEQATATEVDLAAHEEVAS